MRQAEPPILLRWFIVFTIFFLFVLSTKYLGWLIVPCFLALVLFYFLSPFVEQLEGWGLSHGQSVWAIFIFLGLFAFFLGPPILQPLLTFREETGAGLKTYLDATKNLLFSCIDLLQRHTDVFDEVDFKYILEGRLNLFVTEDLPKKLPNFVLILLGFIPLSLLVPFTAFFLLRDGRDFKKAIVQSIPNAFFERALFLFYRVDRQVTGFLLGVTFEAVVVGVLIGTGHYFIEKAFITHPGHYVLIGALAAIFNLVPYLGPFVIYLATVVITYTDTGDAATVLWVTLLFAATKLVDDFLVAPMVLGKSMKIHPLAVVMALFIAGHTAGFVGLLLALPALGVTIVIFDVLYLTFRDERLQLRHRQTKLTLFEVKVA